MSVVVGAHFLALARQWGEPRLTLVGLGIGAAGIAGFVLDAADAGATSVRLVAGVVPGAILLASAAAGVAAGAVPASRSAPSPDSSGRRRR